MRWQDREDTLLAGEAVLDAGEARVTRGAHRCVGHQVAGGGIRWQDREDTLLVGEAVPDAGEARVIHGALDTACNPSVRLLGEEAVPG
jgi:hypothetical protein